MIAAILGASSSEESVFCENGNSLHNFHAWYIGFAMWVIGEVTFILGIKYV